MRILCPMCGFGREMDEAKIPPRAQMATCPKCTHKFRFRVVDDPEPAQGQGAPLNAGGMTGGFGPSESAGASAPLPGGQDLSATQPDPQAAQRAQAAQAWDRLKTPPPAPKPTLSEPGASSAEAPAQDASPQPGDAPQYSAQDVLEARDGEGQAKESKKSTGSPVPFEDLPLHGFFPGLWATIRMLLTQPGAFFRAMPVNGGMARPLVFHLLLAEFMIVCQYMWSMAGFGATAQYLGSPDLMDMSLGMAQAAPVLLFFVYPVMLVLRLMILTGIVHLLLRTLRAGKSGPEASFRVLCYSAAPLILGVIPAVGPVVGGIWSIALTVVGLKEAHRTPTSTALFAVLVPILLLLAAVLGLMQSMKAM